MERIKPIWVPGEQKRLLSILEDLIGRRLLATREKLGRPAVDNIDVDFWTNFDLEFHKLKHELDLMARLADFIAQYWLPEDTPCALIPLSVLDARTYTIELLEQLVSVWNAEWREDGNVILIGAVTPHVAQFVKDRQSQIKRVIALLGPSLHHICTTWELRPEQYKVLVSQDTLMILDPDVRWHMIY